MMGSKHNDLLGEQVLVAPEYSLLRHSLFVATIFLLGFWEMKDIYQEGSRWFPVLKLSVISLLVIYLNIYVLVPQLLLKRKWYWLYLLVVVYVILLVYFAETWLNEAVYLKYTPKIRELYGKIVINPLLQVLTSVFSLVVLMISSSSVILFRKWAIHDARINDLEKAVTQVELERLKKQVNPQFLVRMLDKADALSGQREKASSILLKLGNVLRYQLYDSARACVWLGSDIQFLTEILTLEQNGRDGFSFSVEQDVNLHNYLVPPLLFLPFVEHIVSANADMSFIRLYFRMDDGLLVFECHSPAENTETGFDTIHRRLTLLYGKGYSLQINNKDHMQIIRLCIPLQQTCFTPQHSEALSRTNPLKETCANRRRIVVPL